MKSILHILLAGLAAALFSSCSTVPTVVNKVEGNSAPVNITNNVTVINNQFASIDAGGHPFRDEGQGVMRYTAPKGFNVLPKLPRGCDEVVRNAHRVAIGRRDGRCHGVLAPRGYSCESDGYYRMRPPVRQPSRPQPRMPYGQWVGTGNPYQEHRGHGQNYSNGYNGSGGVRGPRPLGFAPVNARVNGDTGQIFHNVHGGSVPAP